MVEQWLRCYAFGGIAGIVSFARRDGDFESVRVNRILLKGANVVGNVNFGLLLHRQYIPQLF